MRNKDRVNAVLQIQQFYILLNIMKKTKGLGAKIKDCKSHKKLKTLWNSRKNENGEDVWPKGKLMEYFIAKAF